MLYKFINNRWNKIYPASILVFSRDPDTLIYSFHLIECRDGNGNSRKESEFTGKLIWSYELYYDMEIVNIQNNVVIFEGIILHANLSFR